MHSHERLLVYYLFITNEFTTKHQNMNDLQEQNTVRLRPTSPVHCANKICICILWEACLTSLFTIHHVQKSC